MPSYKDLLTPRYIEFTYLSASDLDDKHIRHIFISTPWCCYIGLPGNRVIVREEFFADEVEKIKKLKAERRRILTVQALSKLCC